MNPRWHLIEKILSGEKTIESRWYRNRISPWGTINVGDTIFFKDAGRPVSARATVTQVLQQELSSITDGIRLVTLYRKELCFTENALADTSWLQKKRYAILVFIKKPTRIAPFHINKAGYGSACAWITIPNIDNLRK